MKILIYIISLAAVSIIIFNLFQIDLENFFSKENFNYGIMILAGFSCLIIMRIMMLNEKINKAKKNKEILSDVISWESYQSIKNRN